MTYKFEDHEAQTIITVTMDGSYEEVLDYLCNKYGTEYVMENMEEITHWLDNVAEKQYIIYRKREIKNMTEREMYDYLENYMGVSEETLVVIAKINGDNCKTYEDILYVLTGYSDFESYMEFEDPRSLPIFFPDHEED